MNRRSFLKIAGITLLAAAGGVAYRAADQGVFSAGQGAAYEPWKTWQTDDSLALIRSAILAANPHNTQPWRFAIKANQIDLYADPARNLGTVDPFRREMYLGLGCALENLSLAAQANGWSPAITWMPDPAQPTWAASVHLTSAEARPSDLYHAIPKRHTNRAAYASRDLPVDTFQTMQALIAPQENVRLIWLTGEAARRFGEATYAATEAFAADAEQSADSGRWFRHDWHDIQTLRDGLTLDAQATSPLITTLGKLLPPLSNEQNDQYWLQATRTQMDNSAAFGILAVPNANDNAARLQAGIAYQRLHLWAVTQGMAMQPVNQIVERAEREVSSGVAPRFGQVLAELVGDPNWQGVLPFRIGYPTLEPLPSPRRAAEQVVGL
jgi:nitroreductase